MNIAEFNCLFFSVLIVKQVFGDMEFVGWYTNGEAPSPDDSHLHEQVRTCIVISVNVPSYSTCTFLCIHLIFSIKEYWHRA